MEKNIPNLTKASCGCTYVAEVLVDMCNKHIDQSDNRFEEELNEELINIGWFTEEEIAMEVDEDDVPDLCAEHNVSYDEEGLCYICCSNLPVLEEV